MNVFINKGCKKYKQMICRLIQVRSPGPHNRSVQEVCHQQQLPRHSDHSPQERGGRPGTANGIHIWFGEGNTEQ